MSSYGTAFAGDAICTAAAIASQPFVTDETTADAETLAMNAIGATINAAFIQVSNDFDVNNPDRIAAALAATWLTLQRAAADVVTPPSAVVQLEYSPFRCRAWRVKGGTSAAPVAFANTFTVRVYKQFLF